MRKGRMFGILVISILLISSSLGMTTISESPQEPPPLFRAALERTGEVPGGAPINNSTLWTYDTDDRVQSSPVVHSGKVFIGTMGGDVLCLDALLGTRIWSFATGGPVESSPAVLDNKVYIGSDDMNVYCLNASDGTLIWKAETGGEIKSSPAVADGLVYVGSNDFSVHCLDALDGDEVWTFKTNGYVYSSPALRAGMVFFGSCDGNMYALNASTGEQLWNFHSAYCPASPAVTEDLVIFGAYDGLLHYLDRETGVEEHSVSVFISEIYSSVGLFTVEYEPTHYLPMVFVADTSGQMLGIGGGGERFLNRSHDAGITSSALVAMDFRNPFDPFIVYGDEGGTLHGVEVRNPYIARDLEYIPPIEWNLTIGSSIQSSPFIWHERVYVGAATVDGGGRVVCVGGPIRDDERSMTVSEPVSLFGRAAGEGTVEIVVETYNFLPDRVEVWFDGEMKPATMATIYMDDDWPVMWEVEFPATRPEGPRMVIARAYEDDVEVFSATGQVMSIVEGWDTIDVTIDEPEDRKVVKDAILLASGKASSNYSIWWVRYQWDDEDYWHWKECSGTENWTAAIETHEIKDGWHSLRIIASDYYRVGTAEVRVHIGEEEDSSVKLSDITFVIFFILLFVYFLRTKPARVSDDPSKR